MTKAKKKANARKSVNGKVKVAMTRDEKIADLRRIGGEEYGDQLVAAFIETEEGLDRMAEAPIRAYWLAGCNGRQIVSTEAAIAAREGKVPKHLGSRKLTAYLGLNADSVLKAGHLYDAFPNEPALLKLTALRRADGRSPGFGMIAMLCRPDLTPKRDALLKQALASNWSETDVRDALRGDRNLDKPGVGGVAPKIPKSLKSALARWQREANSYVRYGEVVFKADVITDLLAAEDAGAVPPGQVEAVLKTVEQLRATADMHVAVLNRIFAARTAAETPAAVQPAVTQEAAIFDGQDDDDDAEPVASQPLALADTPPAKDKAATLAHKLMAARSRPMSRAAATA